MGSGDPSGLQNRRDLALLGLVSSTLTRFRQFSITLNRLCPWTAAAITCALLDLVMWGRRWSGCCSASPAYCYSSTASNGRLPELPAAVWDGLPLRAA